MEQTLNQRYGAQNWAGNVARADPLGPLPQGWGLFLVYCDNNNDDTFGNWWGLLARLYNWFHERGTQGKLNFYLIQEYATISRVFRNNPGRF